MPRGLSRARFEWRTWFDDEQWLVQRSVTAQDFRARSRQHDEPAPRRRGSAISDLTNLREGTYLEFSKLDETPDSILRFAESYGMLGIEQAVPGTSDDDPDFGEPLHDWRAWIRRMRTAVTLMRALQQQDDNIIKDHLRLVRRSANRGVAYWRHTSPSGEEFEEPVRIGDSRWPDLVEPREYSVAGRLALAQLVNQGVRAGLTPFLQPVTDRFILSHRPERLLAALWQQLALAITEQARLRTCEYCGTLFEIPRGGRSDKRFDFDSCRDAAKYRARIAKNRQSESTV